MNKRQNGGSVMILALWALLLLSVAIFAWVKIINLNIAITGDRSNGLTAKALAHSGVMVALDPQVTRQTPLLNQSFGSDQSYKVQMTGEAGRLNLNWIFNQPQTPDAGRVAIFQRYLDGRGLNMQEQEDFIDSIENYLGPAGIHKLNGAVDSDTYHPPHRGSFLSVEELVQVADSGPLVKQAGWEDDFTIYSSPGTIDLQSATLPVLEALPGIGGVNAERFIQARLGPDGIDGTADDLAFKDVTEAMSYLGLNSTQAQLLANYVEVENPLTTVRIISVGQCGNVTRRVEVVAIKQGMQPNIMSWKEQ